MSFSLKLVNGLILFATGQVQGPAGEGVLFMEHRVLTDIVCNGKFYSTNNRLYYSRGQDLHHKSHAVGALLEGSDHWTLFYADLHEGDY